MYMPQNFHGMPPNMAQMKQPMPMVPPGYMHAKPQSIYPQVMMGGMPNLNISLQAQPMPPTVSFRSIKDVTSRRDEFNTLSKSDRQEILGSILVGKLKVNKNPEL